MIDTNRTPTEGLGTVAGDGEAAFATFYAEQHLPQLRRATALARTKEAAADAVHEAFVDVYRQWDQLSNPAGYLSKAVVNRCRDDGRKASSRDRVRLRLIGESATRSTAVSNAGPVTADDALWQALSDLPYNQRAAIVLRHFAGYSEAEIAELLDCSTGSVGPWISRGLTKIRRRLNQ